VADGWRCPDCRLVLAPFVAEHKCAPPSAGVTTAVPQPAPFTPTTGVAITAPYAVTATTGHLGVASTSGPTITRSQALAEVYPPRLEIAGDPAA